MIPKNLKIIFTFKLCCLSTYNLISKGVAMKNKIVAGVLGILLGNLGIHKFF
jgi:hypothetical protein